MTIVCRARRSRRAWVLHAESETGQEPVASGDESSRGIPLRRRVKRLCYHFAMGTGETYSVNCVHCAQTFDALEAEWCSCLTTERTLACPHCGKCFCRGPAAYKRTFWSAAPKALWDRKFEEHNRGFEKPPPENPDDLKRPLVLIVDDERDIRRIATRGVEGLGYGVLLGENGEEALELARRYRPDLVLTDALMPKMDGRELCKMIKGDPEIKGTKV